MAQNNLRIIYQNIVDVTSSLVASSVGGAGTSVSNLQKDVKSLVYRSAVSASTNVGVNLVLEFPVKTVGGTNSGIGVILPFTNLTSVATIRVRGYIGTPPTTGSGISPTATTPGTLRFDSGIKLACPYQNLGFSNWNSDDHYVVTSSTSTYTDRKVYARVWIPIPAETTCTSLLIEIVDTNINQYIEMSRLIVGKYWSPKYNTNYGLSAGTKDTSSSQRSEAGDLLTSNGYKYSTLSFDLKWLTKEDRSTLNKIVRLLGTSKPMFVSLFPDNSDDWDKEQMYQIYGKISDIALIDHSIFEMYGSQLELEEV